MMCVLTEKNTGFLFQIFRVVVFFNRSSVMFIWTDTLSRVGSSQVVSTDLSMNAECLTALMFLPHYRSPPSYWWLSWRFWPLHCSSARGLSERGNNNTLMDSTQSELHKPAWWSKKWPQWTPQRWACRWSSSAPGPSLWFCTRAETGWLPWRAHGAHLCWWTRCCPRLKEKARQVPKF